MTRLRYEVKRIPGGRLRISRVTEGRWTFERLFLGMFFAWDFYAWMACIRNDHPCEM